MSCVTRRKAVYSRHESCVQCLPSISGLGYRTFSSETTLKPWVTCGYPLRPRSILTLSVLGGISGVPPLSIEVSAAKKLI